MADILILLIFEARGKFARFLSRAGAALAWLLSKYLAKPPLHPFLLFLPPSHLPYFLSSLPPLFFRNRNLKNERHDSSPLQERGAALELVT